MIIFDMITYALTLIFSAMKHNKIHYIMHI